MKPDGSLTDLEMWPHWRDSKGYGYALESQYPELLEKDERISWAVSAIEAAKSMIDSRMKELSDEENKLNGWEE